MTTYQIHPSVGVARLGNSPGAFYLEPETIGGRPLRCDEYGNPALEHGRPVPVRKFKDDEGRVLRQGSLFRVFARDGEGELTEVTLKTKGVASITWTAHLANKKAAWYGFAEQQGDLMYGNGNSYQAQKVAKNNPDRKTPGERRKLIIDPGPRSVSGARQSAEFSQDTIPPGYPFGSFPPPPKQGIPITTLGGLRTDDEGRLVVLGGYGNAAGDTTISSFGGASTWHDDIADGPVYCTIEMDDGTSQQLTAWCLVGSPRFAPELVNVVTLDDIAFDVAVRYQNLAPGLYANGAFDPGYVASFDRDIGPVMRRLMDALWVANVPSMAVFSAPRFDVRDPSEANRPMREAYFRYFRHPLSQQEQGFTDLGTDRGAPMMPLQSGSNSVSNVLLWKFLTLTQTQYFLLGQWAAGKFENGPGSGFGLNRRDRASLGNCVGSPMCPGIEVTWSTTNPAIWDPASPFRILHAYDEAHYRQHGLDPMREEATAPGFPAPTPGCEPGDLTKRMAIPWQADFFQCTAQFINYSDPQVNQSPDNIPVPPTYYAYWWPVQSPMFVLSGYTALAEQQAAGVPAGFQVYYPRGVNSFAQMITGWSYLGFVVNQNEGEDRELYPYFVERERLHDRFEVASMTVGTVDNFVNPTDVMFWPVWYMKNEPEKRPALFRGVPGAMARPQAAPGELPVRSHVSGGMGRRHDPRTPAGEEQAETIEAGRDGAAPAGET
jgi:L-lysine 6-oxidase